MLPTETPDIRSPFPTFGELYRILANAFDVKQPLAKKIDRLAQEGDYDWSIASEIWKVAFSEHLKKYIDPDFVDFLVEYGYRKHDDYIRLILNVQVDALSRKELVLLLQDELASSIYLFLDDVEFNIGSPDLKLFTSPDSSSVKSVFDWIGDTINIKTDLIKYVYPHASTQKEQRRNPERWITGKPRPDLSSIVLFSKDLSIRLKKDEFNDEVRNMVEKKLKCWLLLARVLDKLSEQTAVYGIDLKKLLDGYVENKIIPESTWMLEYCLKRKDTVFYNIDLEMLLQECLENSIQPNPLMLFAHCLNVKNFEHGQRLSALHESRDQMLKVLDRNEYFVNELQKKSLMYQLEELKSYFHVHDNDGRASYELKRIYGRYYLLCGDFKSAALHYDEAIHLALYRAGQAIKPHFEEVLYFYAHIEDIKKLKRLRHRGVALGLLKPPVNDHEINFTVEELNDLKVKFQFRFPNIARLKYAQK